MNDVEIEEAVPKLASEPFDPKTFPYSFLEARPSFVRQSIIFASLIPRN